jgi:lysophospholipase L1-like esterase
MGDQPGFRIGRRFVVEAVSRHPRLDRDYNRRTHTYADSYVNPRGYAITVDAFPGKTLLMNRGDQQLPPGGDPKSLRDIWMLDGPPGTTGFEFSITGSVIHEMFSGRVRRSPFSAKATKRLVTMRGEFREERDDNAWNWRIDVPGPGIFDVTVKTLTAGGAGGTRTHKIVLRDLLVVSIGDSAASGQGNPDIPGSPAKFDPDIAWWEVFVLPIALYKLSAEAYRWTKNLMKRKMTTLARAKTFTIDMDPEPVWLEPKAYRSLRSGHAYAARLLEDKAKGTVVTFLPFGRTGSTIKKGLLNARSRTEDQFVDNIGQIAEVVRTIDNKRIDALLIYIGVNDVGVAGRLKELLSYDPFLVGQGGDASRALVAKRARDNIAKIPDDLVLLKAALKDLNIRHVYLTEYPTGLFDGATGEPSRGCGIFDSEYFPLDLTVADARLIRQLTEELNKTLRDAADDLGWFFITGIAAGFQGHGYCTDDRFFVQAEESMALQGDTEGTIHPNPDGVVMIGKSVAAAVRKNTFDQNPGGVVASPGRGRVLGN